MVSMILFCYLIHKTIKSCYIVIFAVDVVGCFSIVAYFLRSFCFTDDVQMHKPSSLFSSLTKSAISVFYLLLSQPMNKSIYVVVT